MTPFRFSICAVAGKQLDVEVCHAVQGYSIRDVKNWDIRRMVRIWSSEVAARQAAPGDFTMLPAQPKLSGSLSAWRKAAVLTHGVTLLRPKVTLMLEDKGPRSPARTRWARNVFITAGTQNTHQLACFESRTDSLQGA